MYDVVTAAVERFPEDCIPKFVTDIILHSNSKFGLSLSLQSLHVPYGTMLGLSSGHVIRTPMLICQLNVRLDALRDISLQEMILQGVA